MKSRERAKAYQGRELCLPEEEEAAAAVSVGKQRRFGRLEGFAPSP